MTALYWALIAVAILVGWAAVGAVVALLVCGSVRVRDRQIPKGWHEYDPRCACAACERGEPSSPYLKVPPLPDPERDR